MSNSSPKNTRQNLLQAAKALHDIIVSAVQVIEAGVSNDVAIAASVQALVR